MPAPRALRLAVLVAVVTGLPALTAAAEIRFDGEARMGVLRSQAIEDPSPRWSFTQRLRLTLRAEGETDGGLRFGGQLRLDTADRAARGGLTPDRN